MKVTSLKYDFCIKEIMENEIVRKHFISDVLGIPLDEWHSLFNAETEEDLDMIRSETKNLGFIEAIKGLKDISITDRIRLEREYRLKAKRDRKAEDDFVYEQGRIVEREAGIRSLVNVLRRNGYSDEQIVSELITEYGISHEEALERLNF